MLINKSDISLLRKAIKYIKPYKLLFILAFLVILSGIIISIIQPLLWAKLLVHLFDRDIRAVFEKAILILIVYTASSGVNFFQTYLLSYLSQQIIFDLKRDMYYKILNLPIKAFDEMSSGDFISRLHGDAGGVADIITNQLLNSLVELLRVLIIGIMIFSINVYLALIVLVAFPITYWIFYKSGIRIRRENESLLKVSDRYFTHASQTIMGIREIRSLGAMESSFKRFLKLSSDLKSKSIKMTVLNGISQVLSQLVNFITEIAILLAGGYFVYLGTLSMERFIAFTSYSGQFSGALMSITELNISIQKVMTSLERIFDLMDNLGFQPEKTGTKKIQSVNGDITFSNVSFGYNKDREVLQDVNLEIQANRKIAIVGPSGSGKSTLFNLLLRFYNPDRGKILIDGVDISDIDEISLHKSIAVVRQEPYFLSMSIKDNLRLSNPEASDQKIENACSMASIHQYISSLPDGYNTVLGENGIKLSGGQKQRLAIARALLRHSKIILFDEATSALDNESQAKINQAINKIAKQHTVILIAHRLTTVLESDEIIVIENGRVAGQGKHQDLISNNEVYKKLYEAEILKKLLHKGGNKNAR